MAWLSNWAPEPTNPCTKITGLSGDRDSWAAAADAPAMVAGNSVTIVKIAPKSFRIMVLSPCCRLPRGCRDAPAGDPRISRALMSDSGRDDRSCQGTAHRAGSHQRDRVALSDRARGFHGGVDAC